MANENEGPAGLLEIDDSVELEGLRLRSPEAAYVEAERVVGEPAPRWFVQKRIADLVLATTLLLALSPLLVACAVAVALTSRGPIFFVQERIGCKRIQRGGAYEWVIRPFRLYKFRSMYVNADADVHKTFTDAFIRGDEALLGTISTAPGLYKLGSDKRITAIGHILRRLSLDELPQLFNVVKGDMSMIGPRPPMQYEVDAYSPRHMSRFHATQGISGLWQVMGRAELTFEQMIDLDIEYVRTQSWKVDTRIAFKTVAVVLTGRGAA